MATARSKEKQLRKDFVRRADSRSYYALVCPMERVAEQCLELLEESFGKFAHELIMYPLGGPLQLWVLWIPKGKGITHAKLNEAMGRSLSDSERNDEQFASRDIFFVIEPSFFGQLVAVGMAGSLNHYYLGK